MLRWLKGVFSSIVYIQLWEDRVKIVNVGSKAVFDEPPYIAVDKSEKKVIVVAVGNEAYGLLGSSRYEVLNPFSHPRLLVHDFAKAEKVLQYGIRAVCRSKLFQSSLVVIHPCDKLDGGLTDVECRLFRELALGSGARKAYLHIGSEIPLSNFSLSNFSLSNVNEPK